MEYTFSLLPKEEAEVFNKELQDFLDSKGLRLEAEPRFMKNTIKNPNGSETLDVFSQVIRFVVYKKIPVEGVVSPIQDVNSETTS